MCATLLVHPSPFTPKAIHFLRTETVSLAHPRPKTEPWNPQQPQDARVKLYESTVSALASAIGHDLPSLPPQGRPMAAY